MLSSSVFWSIVCCFFFPSTFLKLVILIYSLSSSPLYHLVELKFIRSWFLIFFSHLIQLLPSSILWSTISLAVSPFNLYFQNESSFFTDDVSSSSRSSFDYFSSSIFCVLAFFPTLLSVYFTPLLACFSCFSIPSVLSSNYRFPCLWIQLSRFCRSPYLLPPLISLKNPSS